LIWIPVIFLLHEIAKNYPGDFEIYNRFFRLWGVYSFTGYFWVQRVDGLGAEFVPSTLLTSVWVMLFLISSIIAELLGPIEYLRRFTL
jgi:hypothetical protein